MRLRTFESFWLLKNGLLYTYPAMNKNINTQVLVVGGGITGALISHALIQQGYTVVLIDKRDIGQGSTSATTSMLQYEIDEKLIDLSKKIGEAEAAYCYKAGINAIKNLQKLIRESKIECGFKMKKSLYIAHNKKNAVVLKKEYALRKKYKLGVTWLTAAEVKKKYGIISCGAILSNTAASADAYKLAHELIALNVKKGMQVFDQTEIETFNTKGKKPKIITANGNTVTAEKIIFCNGFESTLLLNEKVARLIYTYAAVSEPQITIQQNLKNTLVWDTSEPYIYLRTTDDGRLLVGGADDVYTDTILQQNIKEKKSLILQKKLGKIMPKVNFIEDFSWGGVFGTTKDGLPYIGASPEFKNCLFVLGFGGNGITFSVQGMQIITDLLAEKPNRLQHYYRFGR